MTRTLTLTRQLNRLMQRRTYLTALVGGVGLGTLAGRTRACEHDGAYGSGVYGAGLYADRGGR